MAGAARRGCQTCINHGRLICRTKGRALPLSQEEKDRSDGGFSDEAPNLARLPERDELGTGALILAFPALIPPLIGVRKSPSGSNFESRNAIKNPPTVISPV